MVYFIRLYLRRKRRIIGAEKPVVKWPPLFIKGWLIDLLSWLGRWRVFIYIKKKEEFILNKKRRKHHGYYSLNLIFFIVLNSYI